jgi:hypothetical protein
MRTLVSALVCCAVRQTRFAVVANALFQTDLLYQSIAVELRL